MLADFLTLFYICDVSGYFKLRNLLHDFGAAEARVQTFLDLVQRS
jgi:hypothetical protein